MPVANTSMCAPWASDIMCGSDEHRIECARQETLSRKNLEGSAFWYRAASMPLYLVMLRELRSSVGLEFRVYGLGSRGTPGRHNGSQAAAGFWHMVA